MCKYCRQEILHYGTAKWNENENAKQDLFDTFSNSFSAARSPSGSSDDKRFRCRLRLTFNLYAIGGIDTDKLPLLVLSQ
jgi:hypothetical protein